MLRWTIRPADRGSVLFPQDYDRRNPRLIRASITAALFTVLILLVACVPAVAVDPGLVMTIQPTTAPEVFLPRAALLTATPVVAEEPAAVHEPAVSATPQPIQDVAVLSQAESSPPESAPPDVTTYVVQSGDTLLGLALDFGVPIAAIQLSNNLGAETILLVDQVLKVPREAMWAKASPFWIVHQVASGETLSELAAQFGLGLGDLLEANGLSDADLIAVGQPLILPLDGPAESVVAAPVLAVAPEPEIVPTSIPDAPVLADAADAAEVAALGAGDQAVDGQAGATANTEPTAEPVPAPVAPADASALAGEVFLLINEQRAAYGLPALAWNGTLAYAAQLHADDCYARGWCGHTGSDGASYKERILRAGYVPVRWSECWAWYGTPQMAVAMWMDEVPPNDPHRRTLLSDSLTEVGVGAVPGNGRGYYFIADFGTPGN